VTTEQRVVQAVWHFLITQVGKGLDYVPTHAVIDAILYNNPGGEWVWSKIHFFEWHDIRHTYHGHIVIAHTPDGLEIVFQSSADNWPDNDYLIQRTQELRLEKSMTTVAIDPSWLVAPAK
jgi:hypothetical protein